MDAACFSAPVPRIQMFFAELYMFVKHNTLVKLWKTKLTTPVECNSMLIHHPLIF